MIPARLLDAQRICARYDELRASGSSVVWCEGAILVEFDVHPTELRRMQAELNANEGGNHQTNAP